MSAFFMMKLVISFFLHQPNLTAFSMTCDAVEPLHYIFVFQFLNIFSSLCLKLFIFQLLILESQLIYLRLQFSLYGDLVAFHEVWDEVFSFKEVDMIGARESVW